MNQEELDEIIKNTKFIKPGSYSKVHTILEIEYDLDYKKKKVYVTSFKIIRCPFCSEWSIAYESRIPIKYIDRDKINRFKYVLITATACASPRHSHCLLLCDDSCSYDNRSMSHSDNHYAGWAGDHREYVWGFYPHNTSAMIITGATSEMKMMCRRHAMCSRLLPRTRLLVTDRDPVDIDRVFNIGVLSSLVDDNSGYNMPNISTMPHYTCLIRHLLENCTKYIRDIGNLTIYECEYGDLYRNLFSDNINIPLASHVINYDADKIYWYKEITEITVNHNEYILFKSDVPFTVASLHHEIIDLPCGVYLFEHAILDYD